MNGNRIDPAYETEWAPVPRGMMQSAGSKAAARRKLLLDVVWYAVVLGVMGALFWFAAQPAEARQRFAACNVQKVVAAPVVHHAAAVVAPVVHAAPVVHQQAYVPPVQNFFYSVGQPLVQQSQMAAAVKDAMAELQFNAQVNGTISGSVTGGAQGYYQQPQYQQPAPQWTPPPQPPAKPQPPAEPTPEVTELPQFSMTMPHRNAVFDQQCGKCHANGAKKGGFAIENITTDQVVSAINRIHDGSMPPSGPLDHDQKQAIHRFIVDAY